MSGAKAPSGPDPAKGKAIMDDDPSEHILTCVVCGQSFDMRDMEQLEHHEQETHQSLPRH